MFTSDEFKSVNREFLYKQAERKQKIIKIWGYLLAITIVVILIIIAVFPNQFKSSETVWILPTYGGMLLLTTLVAFLVSFKYLSEKPFFEYLYSEIYKHINKTEHLNIEYKAYDKDDITFNKAGGLFTSFASVKVKRHIKGETKEYKSFNIYDCMMTTSNGKSQQVHFDGVYLVLEKQANTTIQIRSNGAPKLKGLKFDKQDENEILKIFKEKGDYTTDIDKAYINFMNELSKKAEYRRVYMSIVDKEIHLALWYKKHPARKQKDISVDSINKSLNYFMSEYQLINDIAAINK